MRLGSNRLLQQLNKSTTVPTSNVFVPSFSSALFKVTLVSASFRFDSGPLPVNSGSIIPGVSLRYPTSTG